MHSDTLLLLKFPPRTGGTTDQKGSRNGGLESGHLASTGNTSYVHWPNADTEAGHPALQKAFKTQIRHKCAGMDAILSS